MMDVSEPRHIRSGAEAGFTLIELLVSLALLALILALIPNALRTGRRGWDDQRAAMRAEIMANGVEAVRLRLAAAMPVFDKRTGGPPRIAFAGEVQRVAFVAAAANGPEGGGIFRHEIAFARRSASRDGDVVLTLFPFDHTAPDTAPIEVRPLLSNVTGFSVRYFGLQGEPAERAWHTAWSREDRLPELVAINVERPAMAAETVVVELRLRMTERATSADGALR